MFSEAKIKAPLETQHEPILEEEQIEYIPLDLLRNRILKRTVDVTISLGVVVVHLPFIILIGMIIRLTSKGSAIFRQIRIGKDGEEFIINKFRTMKANHHKSKAEAISGIGTITEANDPRITKTGMWLRKTGFDELPQFFNVLMGDMSITGPRPYMLSEDKKLEETLIGYSHRRRVKPGITGWAQVNGYRGGTKDMILMQKRTDHDLWYIENWSFGLDIRIIAITIVQIIKGFIMSCIRFKPIA